MGKIDITTFFIYRWRYWLGYGFIAIGLIAILVFAGLYVPGGISNQEIHSTINSSAFNYKNIVSYSGTDSTYSLLQHASLAIFGVSIISIKLPSIILAFLSAIGIVLLLRRWFKPSIGVLASLIAITTGQFIFIAQDGTSGVLYLFLSVWLILLASLISRRQKFRTLYLMAFFVLAALSLYTPISIYSIIALIGASLFHPHLRYVIKNLPRQQLFIGFAVALLLIAPLIINVIITPSLGLTLLGIPSQWPDFGANLASLGSQYFGFAKPGGTTFMTPLFELGSMLIIALGAYNIFRNRVAAKSYIILIWILFLIPIIILNPNYTSISFLPLVLLLASGLNTLLAYWYELFPRNPYARIGGLIPLVILVSVLVFSGADRYIHGYKYDPNIAPNFSNDLSLIPTNTTNLVVTSDELAFYQVVAAHNKKLIVSTVPSNDMFLASRAAKKAFPGYKIDQIVTSSNLNQSDRFYLYKKIAK